ncbi:MAG: acetyl-CoA carboxylase biotin carboxyl carrier protein subunit [Thermoplasmata archaeon]|nr:biotin/lipoyl-binding protein [Euryarchaeota archaeon]RLF66992.1 MAG: acetyl-CoA carboxylase biotin carboxyl carrier protein subunit [Thermoplasmata archaeon]
MKFKVVVNGKEYVVEVEEIAGVPVATSIMRGSSEITVDEKPKEAVTETPKVVERVKAVSKEEVAAVQPPAEGIGEIVRAPLPGKITRVLVSEGQEVKSGQTVLYIEAMKMENEVVAPKDGRITKLYVKPGDSVNTDDPLFAVS